MSKSPLLEAKEEVEAEGHELSPWVVEVSAQNTDHRPQETGGSGRGWASLYVARASEVALTLWTTLL